LPARNYFATFGLKFKAVREVGRLMGPRLLGVAAVQINFVVNTILATSMIVGSLTSLKYAWAIMSMPQVVIAQSIAIAALPTFSAQVATGKIAEMRGSLAATLRGVILLSLPATAGLIILRQPIIAMLFERGAFTAQSTELVSWALLWYSVGLLGHGVVELLSRAFYALQDTKTPVFISIGAMSLNVILSLSFASLFTSINWYPFGGLALANSLATALEMGALWLIMHRRLNGLRSKHVLAGFLKSLLATLLMSLVLWVWLDFTSTLPVWLVAAGGILIGGLVYGSILLLLRTQEADLVIQFLRKRAR
jgi:putative peptidoglycan lipid II flippase